jgi:hypothetical protein
LLISFFIAQSKSVLEMHKEWEVRLRGQAGLELMNYPNSDFLLRTLYPVGSELRLAATALNDLGRLDPPILAADDFSCITSPTPASGVFQECVAQSDGSIRVGGSALLPSGRPADCVLITQDTGRHSTVIWMIRVAIGKTEIARIAPPETPPGCWKDTIPARQISAGKATLSAWAFDATTRTAYRLDQSRSVRASRLATEPAGTTRR